jgi:hypothetical protein
MSDDLTSEQARERLTAANELAASTARRGAAGGAITAAGVGALVALVLAATYLTLPDHPVAFALSFAFYGVALTLLIRWQLRTQVVAQRGFGRAYGRSFALTMTLYVIGIASLLLRWPWPVMAAYCVLVALPMVATAVRIGRGRP